MTRRKHGTLETGLATATLVIVLASCGSDRTGGADAAGPDNGRDITAVDVHFDLFAPKDLSHDPAHDTGKDGPGEVGNETFIDTWVDTPPAAPAPNAAGQVLVTEFMADSQTGADKGEWVELFNATAGPLDLGGCEFGDDGSDNHLISTHLVVEAGGFLVMARSDDPELNHGLEPDYVYDDFTLANSDDEIVLTCGGAEIDRVEYDADWVTEGVAIQLGSTSFDASKNDLFESWCPATLAYGNDGMLGTPGEPNEECIVPDPCDPNPCTEPPPPECDPDGVTLITYGSTADCTVEDSVPVCGAYPTTQVDCSLTDQVCADGLCVEPPPPSPYAAGQILITEFMPKSGPGSDPGEWVEVFNTTAETLDLGGCVLGDDGGDAHTIAGPLLVAPGMYAILAKSDDGFTADYLYTGFQMVNDGDQIVLTCGDTQIDRVAYTVDWVEEGIAAQLSNDAFDATMNDDAAHWCPATVPYGDAGKIGTPGEANGACPNPCDPNPCTEYPAPECDPDNVTLHSWTTPAPCSLVFGTVKCEDYPDDPLDCSLDGKVCIEGACTDPCDPNPCTEYPNAACDPDGLTLLTWVTPAQCTIEGIEPICGEYPSTPVDCSLDGKVCVGDECVPDPCDPNPCTEYPDAVCDPDGVTLLKWETPASCTNNGLAPVCGDYAATQVDCSLDGNICLGGACVPDPCEPNPCTSFP
ncbi:MAG: lamin tail domain-containing protein, partial [Deltaproteobacteria bacterium]|nr:lamin tail domain-containing protein [Deltaproteobacteria bacterium]